MAEQEQSIKAENTEDGVWEKLVWRRCAKGVLGYVLIGIVVNILLAIISCLFESVFGINIKMFAGMIDAFLMIWLITGWYKDGRLGFAGRDCKYLNLN